ncbi:MAG: hypothetical protein STSR0004_22310 [Peptococcaceae bacterium]
MNNETPAIKMGELLKRLFHLSKKPLINLYLKTKGEMDEVAYQDLVKTAEDTIRAMEQALEEGKVTLEDAGEMNAILVNIMEYLYGKYGDYRKIDQEVKI